MEKQKQQRIARIESYTDVRKAMNFLYRALRLDQITISKFEALSKHLDRMHRHIVTEADVDIGKEFLAIERRLKDVCGEVPEEARPDIPSIGGDGESESGG